MIPVLNIIHLPKELFEPTSALYAESVKREENIKVQAYNHKFTYGIWDGIIKKGLPFVGISKSHKQIVQHAKDNGLNICFIAEDDFRLNSPVSWKNFLDNIPDDFDIYQGGISGGSIDENTKEITGWSGMFLYIIHSRFYDVFLSAAEDKNIDRWLSGTGLDEIEKQLGRKPVYKICYPMAAVCNDGVSYKSGEYVQHDKYFDAYEKL